MPPAPERLTARAAVAALAGFVLLAVIVPATARAEQRRVALVIGNAAYAFAPALDNPANDAKLVAATVKQLGFTLIGDGAELDLDRVAMERAIREFGRQIGPDTVALFYYSGHGLSIRGANYLVPVSARLATPSDVDFELVDVDIVERQMDAAHSNLNLIILDACRNNPFGGRGLRDSTGGLAEMRAPTGTLISYAAQPGGLARDGEPGGDSPYTVALANALKLPGVDVLNAFNQVGVAVRAATQNAQTPWVSSSPIDGKFYLGGPPAAEPVATTPLPAPAPPPRPLYNPDLEAVFWQSIQNTGRPEELQAYLKSFPNGTFSDLARMRLAMLQQRSGPDQSAPPPVFPAPAPPSVVPTPPQPAEPPAAGAVVPAPIGPAEITEAQRQLVSLGLSRAGIDGKTGPRTTEAVKLFQRAAALPVDGEITAALLVSLRTVVPTPEARAAALVAMAQDAGRAGRTIDAIALFEEALRLDPRNGDATRGIAGLRRPPEVEVHRDARPDLPAVVAPKPTPQTAVPDKTRPKPVSLPPAPITAAPPAPVSGFSATAMDSRGRRYQSNNADSEGGAVTSALAQCHAAAAGGTCRIVAMAHAAPR